MWRWLSQCRTCSPHRVSESEGQHDFDSPWKEALEKFLRPFLALCFPTIEAGIDWSRDVVFLDKELQALQHDAEDGRKYVDKLVRVFSRDGTESWILVHVEVQAQPDPNLPERMFQYHQRLDQVHRHPVVSLAVLADADPEYRPHTYSRSLWGCGVRFEFPVCKLLDLPEEWFQRPGDPIARVIQAHRAALRTAWDSPQRRMRKLELLLHLKQEEEAGELGRDEVHQVLRLLDWLLQLSEAEEIKLRQELAQLKPEKSMPFVTSFERFARLEGQREGLRRALRDVLLARFGPIPEEMAGAIESCSDADQLGRWHRVAVTAPTLDVILDEVAPDH